MLDIFLYLCKKNNEPFKLKSYDYISLHKINLGF